MRKGCRALELVAAPDKTVIVDRQTSLLNSTKQKCFVSEISAQRAQAKDLVSPIPSWLQSRCERR
jgi:hypothetical protein